MNKNLFIFFILASGLVYSQDAIGGTVNLQPEVRPVQPGVITPVTGGVAIAPNPPSRNRELLPSFGVPTARPQAPVWFGIDIGAYYGQYTALPYADLFFTPYLRLWNLTFAYDLTMRFDFNSSFVTKTWTDPEALISRISMRMTWINPNEQSLFQSISLNISTNNNITLGHGRLFYNYDPSPFSPTETLKTASFSMDASYVGMNAYIANIARPDLFGAEMFFRPLYGVKNPRIDYIKDLRLYIAYAGDFDPTQGIYNGFYDFTPSENPNALHSMEVGIEIPLASKRDIFLLTGYTDISFNVGAARGLGIAAGLIFNFIKIFPIRVEYAQGIDQWSPHFADIFYTLDRVRVDTNSVLIPSKVETLSQNIGWYTVSLGIEHPSKAIFINFEIAGDAAANDLQLLISLVLGQQFLKIFSLDVTFAVRNLLQTNPFDVPRDMALSITARYHMMPNMTWELLWRIRGIYAEQVVFVNGLPQLTAGIDPYQFLGMGFSYRY
ncbi:MAG: hypothetical protein ACRCY4_03040 [Brevinema sp.]